MRVVGGVVFGVLGTCAGATVRFFHRTSAANSARAAALAEQEQARLLSTTTRRRLTMVSVAVGLLFAIVVGRLVTLQVMGPEHLAARNAQRMRTQELPADRGAILDRNGVELAISLPRRSVFADPELVEDPHAAATALAPILGRPVADLLPSLVGDGHRRFVYLARHVEDAVADRVDELALAGIALVDEPKRFTPSGEVASGIVGLTDIDSAPISGLEKAYDELLLGTPGSLVFEQSPDGGTIPVGENQVVPAKKGTDLVLTLDRAMQFEVQRILSDQVRSTGARGGIAVVTKPGTGDVLAMVQVQADEETGEVAATTDAAALTTSYEPGSVMKLVTATGAIEDGLVTPETTFHLPVQLQVADATFEDAEPRGPVTWPVREIIGQSSNVGTILLAQQLGKNRVHDYLTAFGFGTKTAIDFPNERAGHVPSPGSDDWWATSIGTVPIGQGVTVSPMQMLAAYNVIANRGQYVAPRLVSDLIDSDGVRSPVATPDPRRVVSTSTADQLNLILRGVVSSGTGTKAAVDGYTVAGKTGTSRKAQPNGTYRDEDGNFHYESTFVGFAPAETPAVSVLVVIDDPKTEIFGGLVAAPAYSKITEFALRVLGVAPPASDLAAGGVPADPRTQAALVAKGAALDLPDHTTTTDGRIRALPAGQAAPGTPGAAGGPDATGATTGSVTGSTGTTSGSSGTSGSTGSDDPFDRPENARFRPPYGAPTTTTPGPGG